jgi:hypothetical protein
LKISSGVFLRERGASTPAAAGGDDWMCLPIGWTALEARYREMPRFLRKYLGVHSLLYRRLGRLTARLCAHNRRVFTVCQHYRGVEVDRRVKRPENLLVFSCGGNGQVRSAALPGTMQPSPGDMQPSPGTMQ